MKGRMRVRYEKWKKTAAIKHAAEMKKINQYIPEFFLAVINNGF
jgi:hypothetical protein